MSTLEVRELTVYLGRRKIIDSLSFTIGDGLTMLLGRNGCGKSTLMRAILGLIPSSGNILIDGRDIKKLSSRERAKFISYLPQRQTIPSGITVEDYVSMGSFAEDRLLFSSRKSTDRAIMSEIERVGLGRYADKQVAHLSGGEAKLAALARARVQKSSFMLMDEPLAGLDFVKQHEFMQHTRSDGKPVFMSLHDPLIARQYADTILLMDGSSIISCSRSDTALFENTLIKMYGSNIRFEQVGDTRLPIWQND